VVHGALFLLATLAAIAGIFLLLFAEFLALVQVLIYGGAITILLLFALMLTQAQEQAHVTDNPQRPWAALAAVAAFGVLAFAALATPWVQGVGSLEQLSLLRLGETLFTDWVVPFELASAILLVALVGAVVIAWPREEQ
jgi:NADH-quinone oxidoreductase subunit J